MDDLLLYARLNPPTTKFEESACAALLQRAIAGLKQDIEKTQTHIHYDSLPVLSVDAALMTQLFQHLIANAIKFRQNRPPEISVTASLQNQKWVFTVSDNGIGIPTQHQKQIFNIFKRLHSRKDYGGNGMGLAVFELWVWCLLYPLGPRTPWARSRWPRYHYRLNGSLKRGTRSDAVRAIADAILVDSHCLRFLS